MLGTEEKVIMNNIETLISVLGPEEKFIMNNIDLEQCFMTEKYHNEQLGQRNLLVLGRYSVSWIRFMFI